MQKRQRILEILRMNPLHRYVAHAVYVLLLTLVHPSHRMHSLSQYVAIVNELLHTDRAI
jgi:hypothetical protein